MGDRQRFILLLLDAMMREEKENIFMAKFCTKCGRRLIDGQPCSCTQTQQPVNDMQGSVQKEFLYTGTRDDQTSKYRICGSCIRQG